MNLFNKAFLLGLVVAFAGTTFGACRSCKSTKRVSSVRTATTLVKATTMKRNVARRHGKAHGKGHAKGMRHNRTARRAAAVIAHRTSKSVSVKNVRKATTTHKSRKGGCANGMCRR